MDSLLERLQRIDDCKDFLRKACKNNGLNTSLGGELTVPKLKLLNQKFKRAYSLLKDKISTNWIQNQLRAFCWILLAISALDNVLIKDFEQNHLLLLQNIFQYKTRNFLKFQKRRFLQQRKSKNKNWKKQQDELLIKIISQSQNNHAKLEKQDLNENNQISEENQCQKQKMIEDSKQQNQKQKIQWNQIARRLFQYSKQQFFRSAKHCRQRWFNHLDNSKIRGQWTDIQDKILQDFVYLNGNKWAQIASRLKRNEHSVKNRYNSLQIKKKKIYMKNTSMNTQKDNYSEEKIQQISIKKQNQLQSVIKKALPQQESKIKGQELKISTQINLGEVEEFIYHIVKDDSSKFTNGNMSFFYSPSPVVSPFVNPHSPSPLNPFTLNFLATSKTFTDIINKNNNKSN